ncbi:hypothetical protein PYH59_10040 [Mammaliicoccus lentus]|uniref:hypothetical protein n=1 Tax=Mammaliicoccus lentus TaxID=42858 RepID=UPI0024A92B46|nr:hypothetical protein [Mammaliicoccus lentus]WHI54176.1 hypothetical protein PYH59_10040 [Mammaliicoccus lentus]
MTLQIISLIMSIVCLIISIIVFRYNRKVSKSYSRNVSITSLSTNIEYLENKVQPLLDKHKEEQEQKEIETRIEHWRSFNKWKIHKGMRNEADEVKPLCGACLNDSLELDVEYKESVEKSMYGFDGYHIKEDYPLSAEQKCTVCGHVADKWKYEE